MKKFSGGSIHYLGVGERPYWFECSMVSTCRPAFDGCASNYDVESRLREAGVLTEDNETDTESCALVVNFKNSSEGFAFIERLNTYLEKVAVRG